MVSEYRAGETQKVGDGKKRNKTWLGSNSVRRRAERGCGAPGEPRGGSFHSPVG